jgi:hypothetical protein
MVSTLLRFCGPAILASTLSDEEVARAVRERRAMRIYVDSCLGTRECGLTTRLTPGVRPDVVFMHPIPDPLCDVEDPWWDYRDDVLRAIDLIPPRRRPGRTRKRPLAPRRWRSGSKSARPCCARSTRLRNDARQRTPTGITFTGRPRSTSSFVRASARGARSSPCSTT